jgi:hypothetical protein
VLNDYIVLRQAAGTLGTGCAEESIRVRIIKICFLVTANLFHQALNDPLFVLLIRSAVVKLKCSNKVVTVQVTVTRTTLTARAC